MFELYWTEAFRSMLPWAEPFFRVISELGSDYFYLALIAIGFWVMDKKASKITALVLIVSSVSNYWLKTTIGHPRPPSTNWIPGAQASNYSLPSGHAQNSMTLWGWFGIKIKTWWMSILSTFLIVTIGLSRIYLGVHWFGDVVLGWIVGLVTLLVIWRLEGPVKSILSKYNINMLYLGLSIFGLIALVLTELLAPVQIAGLEANFGSNGGIMIGLGIGLVLENKYVNFEPSSKHGNKMRVVLRIMIGLTLIFVIVFGTSSILPTKTFWLRAIRYALGAIVVVFVWPFLFKKLNL